MLQKFLRREDVEAATGFPCSTLYRNMDAGEFVRPIRLGGRAVAWPEKDVAAWQAAKLAGASSAEIKALVAKLHADRTSMKEAA